MSTISFHEPGSYPGLPGLFCGCSVTPREDGTLDIQPLARHHFFEEAPASADEETTAAVPDELAEESAPLTSTVEGEEEN